MLDGFRQRLDVPHYSQVDPQNGTSQQELLKGQHQRGHTTIGQYFGRTDTSDANKVPHHHYHHQIQGNVPEYCPTVGGGRHDRLVDVVVVEEAGAADANSMRSLLSSPLLLSRHCFDECIAIEDDMIEC